MKFLQFGHVENPKVPIKVVIESIQIEHNDKSQAFLKIDKKDAKNQYQEDKMD